MDLPFTRLRPEGRLPEAQHPGDAGLDLRAAEGVTVKPGERAMVPTGVAVAIPDGHAGLVLPRSGLASKRGLTLANAPGLIDAGYRGEVVCAVVNLDLHEPVEISSRRSHRPARDRCGAGRFTGVRRGAPRFEPWYRRLRLHRHVLIDRRLKLRILVPRMDGQSADVAQW